LVALDWESTARVECCPPLKPAPDAMVVDTTNLTESEVLEKVLDRVRGLI